MEIYPASGLFGIVFVACLLGGMDHLLLLVAAMLPFGMLAAVGLPSVGGLSLLAVNVAAAGLAGCGGFVLLTRLLRGAPVRVAPATLALALYTGYAVFSATILVRLFAGDTMVFALARGAQGVKVSALFSWEKVWLGPSSSNISQTFYVVLGFGLFVAALHVFQRRGAAFGERCLVLAALVNLVLGTLDALGLDAVLGIVRTARYALGNEASVDGVPRVIGGFSEAASFGAASTMFFGYFASACLTAGRPRDVTLALGSGAFAALSLSSTGLIALAAVSALLAVRMFARLGPVADRTALLSWTVGVAAAATVLAALLIFTEAPTLVASMLDRLILHKSDSSSGAERSAWALGGLQAMIDTWGLGAGTGSLRSNGLIFVLLGNVGIIGTASFIAFLWLAFGGRAWEGDQAILLNARAAAAATLVSLLLSATVPDPGVGLLLLASLAVAAKRPQPVRFGNLEPRPLRAVARRRFEAQRP